MFSKFSLFLHLMLFSSFLFGTGTTNLPTAQQPVNVTSWNFDWDDNIAYMPTKIILYHYSDDNKTIKMSTGDFALNRELVAKKSPTPELYKGKDLRDYHVIVPAEGDKLTATTKHSFKYFRDSFDGKVNYFLKDLKLALQNPQGTWRGQM